MYEDFCRQRNGKKKNLVYSHSENIQKNMSIRRFFMIVFEKKKLRETCWHCYLMYLCIYFSWRLIHFFFCWINSFTLIILSLPQFCVCFCTIFRGHWVILFTKYLILINKSTSTFWLIPTKRWCWLREQNVNIWTSVESNFKSKLIN